MNTTSNISFSHTEEAFFLSCVDEVRKVGASKSGQAHLNISVEDGKVDLQLGFKLGLPRDKHLAPSLQEVPSHSPPRYKTPARKAIDKARAAAHQQRQLHLTNSESVLCHPQDLPPHQQQGAAPALLDQQAAPVIVLQSEPVPDHHHKAAVSAVEAAPASTLDAQSSEAASASLHQAVAAVPPHKASQHHPTAVPALPPPKQVNQQESFQCQQAVSAPPTSEISPVQTKNDKLDDDKVYETYKSTASCLGVGIW